MLKKTVEAGTETLAPLRPVGAVAALLHRRRTAPGAQPILYMARDTRRADELTTILKAFGGDLSAAAFPRWDGSAADRMPASPEAMGRRMSVLRWLLDRKNRPRIVVTTPEALLRRVPARKIWQSIHLEFRVGEAIAAEDVQARLQAIGYDFDERVDEPGEAAIRGRVIEVFPAAAPRPCRIEVEEGEIVAIRSYDPVSQRSVEEVEHLIVDPASENLDTPAAEGGDQPVDETETLFDYFDDAELIFEDGADQQALDVVASLAEEGGYGGRAAFLTQDEWMALAGDGKIGAAVVEGANANVPVFAHEPSPTAALRQFVEPLIKRHYRFVFAGPRGQVLQLWKRRVERALDTSLTRVDGWDAIRSAKMKEASLFVAPINEGFVDEDDKLVCVALRDLAGQAAGPVQDGKQGFGRGETQLRFGDAVVHFEHGVGILEGLETTTSGGGETEALRLRYADDAVLLVPMKEIGMIWRYGGAETAVTLDRLKGENWIKRRNQTVEKINETARRMVEALSARAVRRAEPLKPDRVKFERFCADFPYDLTQGQAEAASAVAADLASGRPMDRLLCGDVGFGKTEVALRALAAAVFSGRQAAIVAPTTVLARQHFDVIRKRFERHGIAVAMLSRLQTPAEARAAKAGIADGSIRILVATHAICGKDVAFDDLALVVIDEEQRFGTRHKNAMRQLASEGHTLSMTATPIPQTLQAGFVGLTDLSVIATPPRRRRPVRTRTVPFAAETVGRALEDERARGGQSFVVCPRIEDIEPVAQRLKAMVPGLSVVTLHGAMKPASVDKAMLAFAAGKGDILLATNIVESGLDVPEANTMVVYAPDRFGLAQLHQLRGRVGRGVRRASMLMALEPEAQISEGARHRLQILEELNALGSGFEISSRDLDMRGAGELLGEEQAGHLQVIGLGLYRRLLEQALGALRGRHTELNPRCEVDLGLTDAIPADYIPEPELRIELAGALDGADDESALEAIREEFTDRFGPLPDSLETAFALVSLRIRATLLGIRKIDGGPKAVAATFSRNDAAALQKRIKPRDGEALRWSDLRLILDGETEGAQERLGAAEVLLDRIA